MTSQDSTAKEEYGEKIQFQFLLKNRIGSVLLVLGNGRGKEKVVCLINIVLCTQVITHYLKAAFIYSLFTLLRSRLKFPMATET